MRIILSFLAVQALASQVVTASKTTTSSSSSLRRQVTATDETVVEEQQQQQQYDCSQGCDLSLGSPVCGSDGTSFQNECLAYCQNISLSEQSSLAACEGHPSMTDNTYDKTSVVTMEVMNRFKEDGFLFVAKRTFEDAEEEEEVEDEEEEEEEEAMGSYLSNRGGTKNKNVIFAHRYTDDEYEYIARFETPRIREGYDPLQKPTKPSSPQLPSWMIAHAHRRGLTPTDRGIVGADTRTRVCLQEACYPQSTIGEFDAELPNGHVLNGGCTGTVISKNAVLTAAHCHITKRRPTNIKLFSPGRYRKYAIPPVENDQGEIVNPYTTWRVQFWTVLSGWDNSDDPKYDIAIARFSPLGSYYKGTSSPNIGELTGFVGIAATTNQSPELQSATVTGYPSDKPDGEMWTSGPCNGGFRGGYVDEITYHDCDSTKGQDGAALLDLEEVVAYGVNVDAILVPGYQHQAYTNIGVIFTDRSLPVIKSMAGIYS